MYLPRPELLDAVDKLETIKGVLLSVIHLLHELFLVPMLSGNPELYRGPYLALPYFISEVYSARF